MLVRGIILPLLTTRNTVITRLEINVSQFGLLTHFTHNPARSYTTSELASVMEMKQPEITKLVSVLLEKGALSAKFDSFDKSKRHLSITDKGMTLCRDVMQTLQPEIALLFSDLQDDEIQRML